MKILIAFVLLFSTSLYADEVVTSLYNCTHKDNDIVRQVKITHLYPGCQVHYIRPKKQVMNWVMFFGALKTQQITVIIRLLPLLRKSLKECMVGFV